MKHAGRMGRRLTLIIVGCGVLLSGVAVAAGTAVNLKGGGTAALHCAGQSLSIQKPNKTSANASCVASSASTSTPTPPAPTTTPPPQTTNCLPSPHLCGFPDSTTTGVPAEVTLQPYTGPTTITAAGTVIDDADVHGPLYIQAANVTVKNSRIYLNSNDTGGQNVALWVKPAGTGFTASHTEVTGNLNGQSYCIAAIANDSTGASFDAVDMHGCGDGIRGGDLSLTNSYMHGFWFGLINGVGVDTPHADCIQGLYGDSNVLFDHNTCNNPNDAPPPGSPGYSNSVVQLGAEGGNPVTNWTIKNSLLQGGGLSINMRQSPITGIDITGNHWGRDNAYGLIGSNTGDSYTWSGNVWDDTGLPATAQPG